jgi:formylglycine-generating enzyme required for sulfatase activity
VTPLRLAKVVVIQHSHAELYELIKQMPRYLADLEIHYQRQAEQREPQRFGTGDGESEPPRKRLPPAVEPFGEQPTLRTLFNLFSDDNDACFGYLRPSDLRSYITLTRRAAPPERRPASPQQAFEPELVDVPATRFLMGSSHQEVVDGQAEDNETPQHWLDLPAYRIGRYPVTNAQYAAFVQAAGHPAPTNWAGPAPPVDLSDYPVVNVSWEDAVAYCRWLSEQTGQTYRLPTEAEWERAASWRGESGVKGQKSRYPWGDAFDEAKCNSKEGGIGATTPVGQFSPAGDSPVGCADMAGNVWEWCSTRAGEKYPFVIKDEWVEEYLAGNSPRVWRGGSFVNNETGVRCAARFGDDSGHKTASGGFRVCLSALF